MAQDGIDPVYGIGPLVAIRCSAESVGWRIQVQRRNHDLCVTFSREKVAPTFLSSVFFLVLTLCEVVRSKKSS